MAKAGPRLVDASGHGIPELLKAIMKLFPLDAYVEAPVSVMDLVPGDKKKGLKAVIWDDYKQIVEEGHGAEVKVAAVERFAFYDRAKKAFAVVSTGETALYGNIILTKGVIGGKDDDE